MRGAGARFSAVAWSAISAGLHPLVSTPLFIRASPDRRRLELDAFLALQLAHARNERSIKFATDGPAAVPQVEARSRPHGVLLRGGERAQGAHVAPVGPLL